MRRSWPAGRRYAWTRCFGNSPMVSTGDRGVAQSLRARPGRRRGRYPRYRPVRSGPPDGERCRSVVPHRAI
ncbi:hypothetical protein E0504_34730 [Parafrankia sp. BMG5.11]|nr:hypothetical protein E0504_34730 [Parafrankia sp. BMG5.11]